MFTFLNRDLSSTSNVLLRILHGAVKDSDLPQFHLKIRISPSSAEAIDVLELQAKDLQDGIRVAVETAKGRPCELWQAGKRLILINCGEDTLA